MRTPPFPPKNRFFPNESDTKPRAIIINIVCSRVAVGELVPANAISGIPLSGLKFVVVVVGAATLARGGKTPREANGAPLFLKLVRRLRDGGRAAQTHAKWWGCSAGVETATAASVRR